MLSFFDLNQNTNFCLIDILIHLFKKSSLIKGLDIYQSKTNKQINICSYGTSKLIEKV
jgi:hypothetical protein